MRVTLQNISPQKGFLLAFIIGFAVRLIPELLSFPNPIGFDTIHYAARMKEGVVWNHWSSFFSTWLIYALLVPLHTATKVDPFLLLKIVSPLLYGGSAAGIYYFAWKALNWDMKKSLFAAVFFVFTLAALRISLDLYRNLFGLTLLLFALPLLNKREGLKEFLLLAVLSMLVVWSHEYAAVTLFAAVAGIVAKTLLRKERIQYWILEAVLPALTVFVGRIYLIVSHVAVPAETSIIMVNDGVNPHPAGLFFLVDYLKVATPVQQYASYVELVSHVASLFVLLYLIWLPLVLVGFFREHFLDAWTGLLLVGSFSCLVVPFSALDYWHRWMLMLVYPFTFYAVNGLWKVLETGGKVASGLKWLSWLKVSKRSALGILVATVFLGSLFMAWPLIMGKYGLVGFPTTWKYFPSTMQTSSVPLQDTEATVEAIKWLNNHMTDTSSLLVHHVFSFWTSLYLSRDRTSILFSTDLEAASNLASEKGFTSTYFIWWNQDIGWYGLTVPNGFDSVFESGRISVFQDNEAGA